MLCSQWGTQLSQVGQNEMTLTSQDNLDRSFLKARTERSSPGAVLLVYCFLEVVASTQTLLRLSVASSVYTFPLNP